MTPAAPLLALKFSISLFLLLLSPLSIRCEAGVVIEGYDTPAYIDFEKSVFIVSEDQTTLVIAVVRTGEFREAAKVDFKLVEGTATEGSDYQPTGGTLYFAAGQSFKTITVPILQDADVEGDETFSVVLDNPGANVVLVHSSATVTIKDVPPVPQVPSLAMHPNGDGTVTISWDDGGTECLLERCDGVATASWETVAESEVVVDGKRCVIESVSSKFQAYRLRAKQQ